MRIIFIMELHESHTRGCSLLTDSQPSQRRTLQQKRNRNQRVGGNSGQAGSEEEMVRLPLHDDHR